MCICIYVYLSRLVRQLNKASVACNGFVLACYDYPFSNKKDKLFSVFEPNNGCNFYIAVISMALYVCAGTRICCFIN
jgi:hypothetical protein